LLIVYLSLRSSTELPGNIDMVWIVVSKILRHVCYYTVFTVSFPSVAISLILKGRII
jgi:hypothetical protein